MASAVTTSKSVVETTDGILEGIEENDLLVFKAVPFAAPPTGDNRWLPPQPVATWQGVRTAQSFADISIQVSGSMSTIFGEAAEALSQSEDCLYLNVWTPGLDSSARPVMIWIHGGGFTIGSGSSPLYDGSRLASLGDVVVVTINYRLGALGFLNLNEVTGGSITATGNEGLLDQIAALKWVKGNISRLGGDPENVTIFGESAGGMSVGALLAMPDAKGLFHKAILQSGACSTAHTTEDAIKVAELLLETLDCKAEKLRGLSAADILAAQVKLAETAASKGLTGMSFQPVIDGEVLPSLPIDAISKGFASDIAILAGSTSEEWKLFAGLSVQQGEFTEDKLVEYASGISAEQANELIEVYRQQLLEQHGNAKPGDVHAAINTDRVFRIPALTLLEQQKTFQENVYSYEFDWKSPVMGGVLGACHAIELGFVFGTHAKPGLTNFFGAGEVAEQLAVDTMTAWINFARHGDPSGGNLGDWPSYNIKDRPTMLLGERSRLENCYNDSTRAVWEKITPDRIGSL